MGNEQCTRAVRASVQVRTGANSGRFLPKEIFRLMFLETLVLTRTVFHLLLTDS